MEGSPLIPKGEFCKGKIESTKIQLKIKNERLRMKN